MTVKETRRHEPNPENKEVYNKISPYLPEEEAKWLEKVTREI